MYGSTFIHSSSIVYIYIDTCITGSAERPFLLLQMTSSRRRKKWEKHPFSVVLPSLGLKLLFFFQKNS